MIATETIEVTVGGNPVTLEVKKDILWGDFTRILDIIIGMSTKGIDNKTVIALFETLLKVGIVNPPPELASREQMFQLGTLEVTDIIGRVIRILPLEKYLENLGTGGEELLGTFSKVPEQSK